MVLVEMPEIPELEDWEEVVLEEMAEIHLMADRLEIQEEEVDTGPHLTPETVGMQVLDLGQVVTLLE